MITGKVGSKTIEWKNTPTTKIGSGVAFIDGVETQVRWVRDHQGIWIETDKGFFGYDIRKSVSDDGQSNFTLLKRLEYQVVNSKGFVKKGEDLMLGSSAQGKKGSKIKSQMPGKIVRVLVSSGQEVKKGQALLVMEAMKMENEIKASQDAKVKDVLVTIGTAIETGAVLITFE